MTEDVVHITDMEVETLLAWLFHDGYYNTLFMEGLFMGTYYEA